MIEVEDYQRLLNAVSELPKRARDVFVMRFVEEESYETIAKRLGKTSHQVRGLCHSAVKNLRLLLGPIEDQTPRRESRKAEESS